MKSLVEVGIATYNRPLEVVKCINSVLQNYPQVGITVVDDNSSTHFDASKIKLVKNARNIGCPASRNVLLENARSKYLFFLDDDATIGDVDLSAAVKLLERCPQIAVLSFGSRNHIGDRTTLSAPAEGSENEADILVVPAFNGGAALVRTEICKNLGGYSDWISGYGEEAELTLKLMENGFAVAYSPIFGAIDHYPNVKFSDLNRSRQRFHDIQTAFAYGGLYFGSRQFVGHLSAAIRNGELQTIHWIFRGVGKGLLRIRLHNFLYSKNYQNWLRLHTSVSVLDGNSLR